MAIMRAALESMRYAKRACFGSPAVWARSWRASALSRMAASGFRRSCEMCEKNSSLRRSTSLSRSAIWLKARLSSLISSRPVTARGPVQVPAASDVVAADRRPSDRAIR